MGRKEESKGGHFEEFTANLKHNNPFGVPLEFIVNIPEHCWTLISHKKYIRLVVITGSFYRKPVSKLIVSDVVEVENHKGYTKKP